MTAVGPTDPQRARTLGSHCSGLSCCAWKARLPVPGLLYTHSTMGVRGRMLSAQVRSSRARCSVRHLTMEGTACATQLCVGSRLNVAPAYSC